MLMQDLEQALREAHHRHTAASKQRTIKLPSKLHIERDSNGLLFRLDAASVSSNMQTDAAAFEGWALTMRLWLGEQAIPHILLDWAVPDVRSGHYERFLYRAAQFLTLFPEWFSVAEPQELQNRRTLTEKVLKLNIPSSKTSSSPPVNKFPEYEFETGLINSGHLREHFHLERVDRQFPVGLFADEVSDATRIFPGGKSAIDIVGVGDDDRLWIFELKAGNNVKVGILSELLLYTGLMREASGLTTRIEFEVAGETTRALVYPEHVKRCSGINAVMLVEHLHPLLEHPKLLSTLNSAADIHWNRDGAKPVCFSKARVRKEDGKFLISAFEEAAGANA